jgi:hypothetical protein
MILTLPVAPAPRTRHVVCTSAFLEVMAKLNAMQAF